MESGASLRDELILVTTTILKTKLYIPRPGLNLVTRPRLLAQLESGLHSKLTLICAPAGFGKTTLLSEWIAESASQFAWVSLDTGDNDPARFLAYWISAIQRIQSRFGAAFLASLQNSHSLAIEAVLTGLINEIAEIPDRLVIVLDDFHVIDDHRISDMVAFMLENLPANMHLVITSRSDPSLPIARLRARGQLNELRAADLRFTVLEVAAFLNKTLGQELNQEDVDMLERRTEGWVVGLQLAALSMQGRADIQDFIRDFSGSHHYIVEYLTEEVLRRQPEGLQQFLLQTSVLDRLSGPLCDVVTGITGSQALLSQMHRENLFIIPLDDTHQWYRYHQLFADLLRARLEHTMTSAEIHELHHRASNWYAANNALDEALRHALAAQDFEAAAAIIEESARSLVAQGQLATLLRWTEDLSAEQLRSHLTIQVYRAWALFLNGQSIPAMEMLLDARARLSSGNDPLRGEVATMLATLASLGQEPEKVIALAEEALAYLPETDLASRARAYRALGGAYGYQGDMDKFTRVCEMARDLALQAKNAFLAASIMELLATSQANRARLRQAAQTYQALVDLGEEFSIPSFPPAGVGYTGLAGIFLEWNDLESANLYLNEGMNKSQRGGIGYNLVHACCTRVRLLSALGDVEGARQALQQAELAYQRDRSLPAGINLSTHQVRYWLARGEVETAYRWALGESSSGEQVIEIQNLPAILDEIRQVSLAYVYLASGQTEQVLAIAARVCQVAQAGDRLARVIEMRMLEALALYALGRTPEALAALAASLVLAEPGGYVRLYVEGGSTMYDLLKAFSNDPSMDREPRNYAARLLQAFANGEVLTILSQPLVEPLTRRELEVLSLISRGYSNQQIAAQLVITLHTVKKHTSNIYGKLGVTSRTQALARGQELGLL